MNGTRQKASAIILVATGWMLAGAAPSALAQSTVTDIDAVEASIKAPDTAETRAAIQAQTAALQESSGRVLSREAALDSSTRIYLSHNRSLLQEMFYHLEQLVPYSNFKERLYLQKLQSLKSNKERFDQGEIGEGRFQIIAQRADYVYEDELDEARNYLAGKATRLREICDILSDNVDSMQRNFDAARMDGMPRALAQRITEMRTNQAWVDFTTPTDTGRHMRRALEQAEDADLQQIASCVASVFDPYQPDTGGEIIDRTLVGELIDQSN